ncbi:MAG: alpha/beta hydrolase [Anaerolineae bacterium]|nr:alpha/beta hydrolase [Anaerolineae bacterium]
MPFVEITTGARLHYEDVGQGEPLIALHGMLGTARKHLSHVMDHLSADYRVLGPTLRGYGQSTPKPRDFPVDFYHRDARDVLAFMDALGIEQAHIIGFSDGGETALSAAGLAPDRFKSVIAWGAVGYFGPAMRPVAQRLYPATWMTAEDKTLHGIADPDAFALAWVHAVKYMIDSGGDVSLSLAPSIDAPVLLMLGERDTLNPQEYGQNYVDRTPRGRLVMFKTGHPIHDEDWDGFKREMSAFLRSVHNETVGGEHV